MKNLFKSIALMAMLLVGAGAMVACEVENGDGYEPDAPAKKPTSATFKLTYCVNSELLEVFDLTMEYTDCEGKTQSVDMPADEWTTNLPKDAKDNGAEKAFVVEVAAASLPATASYSVTYALKSEYPSNDKFNFVRGSYIVYVPNVGEAKTVGSSQISKGYRPEGFEVYMAAPQGRSISVDADGNIVM